jgi:hypothetical protein
MASNHLSHGFRDVGAVDVEERQYMFLRDLLESRNLAKRAEAQQLLHLIRESAIWARATGVQSLTSLFAPSLVSSALFMTSASEPGTQQYAWQ